MNQLRNSPSKQGATILEQTSKQLQETDFHRRQKFEQETQLVGLIRNLQKSKDTELRDDLEKEEIARAIRNNTKEQLGDLGDMKRKELENLGNQREVIRLKEQRIQDEVNEMEKNLYKQEQYFKKMEQTAEKESADVKNATLRTLRSKEMEFVSQQASAVAKIKLERDKLELEREKIMKSLQNLQANRNSTIVKAGLDIIQDKPASSYSNRAIDEEFKQKVLRDEARLNQMKAQQKEINNQTLQEINDIDVMYNELELKPDIHKSIKKLANEFSASENPNHVSNMEALNQRLYQELNPGNTNQQLITNASVDVNQNQMIEKMDTLEQMLIKGSPLKQSIPIAPPSVDPITSVGKLFSMGKSTKHMVNQSFQDPQVLYQSQFVPPQVGFQQQTLPSMQNGVPYSLHPQGSITDPALAQLAQMLEIQDKENQKLKGVLENFGKNFSTQDELEGIISNQSQQLMNMNQGQKLANIGQVQPQIHQSAQSVNQKQQPQVASKYPLPDEFLFRQNDGRVGDMEVEERALMNLAAQELDQLRVIQKLPKDSDLYRHKIKQFRDISAMRTEVEKVLQEQRLEKIKRDYNRQKLDEERAQKHQDWIEKQKMGILEGRLQGEFAIQQLQEQYQGDNIEDSMDSKTASVTQTESSVKPSEKESSYNLSESRQNKKQKGAQYYREDSEPSYDIQDLDKYNDKIGLVCNIDLVHGLPRKIRSLKCVFSGFKATSNIGEAGVAGPEYAEADKNWRDMNKVIFKYQLLMTGIPQSQESKIIFELQAVDPTQPSGFTGVGWTWLNLFSSKYELSYGRWQLPVYSGVTKPDQTQGTMGLEQAAGVSLCVKIAIPGDHLLKEVIDHQTEPNDYIVPKYHQSGKIQKQQQEQVMRPSLLNEQSPKERKKDLKKPKPNQIDMMEEQQQNEFQQPESVPFPQQSSLVINSPEPGVGAIKKDARYKCKGIRIRLNYAQFSKQYENFKARASLFQGQQGELMQTDKAQQCQISSQSYSNKDFTRVKAGQSISINEKGVVSISRPEEKVKNGLKNSRIVRIMDDFEFVWEKDFYTYYISQVEPQPMYLTVELFGKVGNDKLNVIAFAQIDINFPQNGKIKYGVHKLPLFNPPISFVAKEQIEMRDEVLTLSILDPITNKLTLQEQLKKDRPQTAISEQFKPNFANIVDLDDRFDVKKDQFDIYIDQARHLPENVSICRIVVRVVDNNMNDLIPKTEGLSDINTSTLRNQNFNMRIQLKLKKMVPSALILLQMETYSQSSKMSRIVGTTCLPLFMNTNSQEPATLDTQKDVAPHVGAYQMALYHIKPKMEKPFTYERIVFQERVPSASVLFRVMKVQQTDAEDQSKLIPPPDYKVGIYSTRYFNTSEDEQKVMDLRRRRINAPLLQVLVNVVAGEGEDPNRIDLTQFLNEKIQTNKNSELIDLNFHSQYEPSLGFRFNILALHNNKINGFPCVLASILPVASFYDPERKKQPTDAFVFTTPILTSYVKSPKFTEGDEILTGFTPIQPGMCILIDVKMYMPESEKFIQHGFTICPLLQILNTDGDDDTNEYFVNSGNFSLPLYGGGMLPELMDQLLQSYEPLEVLKEYMNQGSISLLDKSSIIVRVIDQQRKLHFRKSIDEELPSNRFMDQQLVKTYKYEPNSGGGIFGGKKLNDLLPSQYKQNPNAFAQVLQQTFKISLGLNT